MYSRRCRNRLRAALVFGVTVALPFARQACAAPLQLSPTQIVIPERGQLAGYVLRTASNTVAFLPPDHWKTDKKSDQVIVVAPDLGATLTLQVFDNLHRTNGWNWAEVRRRLLERSPGGRIVRESDCHASDFPGKAYDVEQAAGNGSRLTKRIAVVPFSSGVVEVTLAAPKSRFPATTYFFGSFMSSLRFAALRANL